MKHGVELNWKEDLIAGIDNIQDQGQIYNGPSICQMHGGI